MHDLAVVLMMGWVVHLMCGLYVHMDTQVPTIRPIVRPRSALYTRYTPTASPPVSPLDRR
jgi:hypothetical protein